jgi:aminoglycoside phosphotransferase (APT) family kinase protein
MSITTDDTLRTYLNSKGIPYQSIHKLTGGTANFVWRLDDAARPSIIKHAEPFIASNPSMSFGIERMDFENRAMTLVRGILLNNLRVGPPEVYSYDPSSHVLHMEYGGQRTLKEAYADFSLDVRAVGRALGAWLARLHNSTIHEYGLGDNEIARRIYRYSYWNLADARKKFGFDTALAERVDKEYGGLIAGDDGMVCHGDFWPGNVLVGSLPGPGEKEMPKLTIVDWEMCRRGNGATDVGQFAAEAWLLDRFRGGMGLLDAFLRAYIKERRLGKEDCGRVAVHFGTHIGFWPTVVDWANEEDTKEVVRIGGEITEKAMEGDWAWLGRSMLKELFRD